MTQPSGLAEDGGIPAVGFGPLAFLGRWGRPSVLIALLNILVFGGPRFYDVRLRSRGRPEVARFPSSGVDDASA